MRQTDKVALGGVLGALSLVCMLLTVIPVATYALPAMAGIVLVPLVVEWGTRYGTAVYVVVGLLSLLLAPDKQAAFLFVAFFGHYPIVKAVVERRVKHNSIRWIWKMAVFNVCVVAAYALMIWAFRMPMDEFAIGGVSVAWWLLLAGNAVFVLYDVALTRVITMYVQRLHAQLMRIVRR